LERKKELLPLPPRKGIKFWSSFERKAGDSDWRAKQGKKKKEFFKILKHKKKARCTNFVDF
jgi:hypothetical protein